MYTAEQAYRLMRRLATEKAALYQKTILLPQLARLLHLQQSALPDVTDALLEAHNALIVIYGHYAFARRGGNKGEYSNYAVEALAKIIPNAYEANHFLSNGNPEQIWTEFEHICRDNNRKSAEQLNRGMLEGFIVLAKEIYEEDGLGNVISWVMEGIIQSQKVESRFNRLTAIRGIGPKMASLILRDIVWLFNLENRILPSDRLFLQPIDAWVRKIAEFFTDEVDSKNTPDWIIAGKLCKAARLNGISGVSLSHGIQYFGNYEVSDSYDLKTHIDELLNISSANPK